MTDAHQDPVHWSAASFGPGACRGPDAGWEFRSAGGVECQRELDDAKPWNKRRSHAWRPGAAVQRFTGEPTLL